MRSLESLKALAEKKDLLVLTMDEKSVVISYNDGKLWLFLGQDGRLYDYMDRLYGSIYYPKKYLANLLKSLVD